LYLPFLPWRLLWFLSRGGGPSSTLAEDDEDDENDDEDDGTAADVVAVVVAGSNLNDGIVVQLQFIRATHTNRIWSGISKVASLLYWDQ
jgi:hypothetical protein